MIGKLIRRDDNSYILNVDRNVMATSSEPLSSYKISSKKCDELFGVVDIVSLARDISDELLFNSYIDNAEDFEYGFKYGFSEANKQNENLKIIKPTEVEVKIIMKNSRTGRIIKSDLDLEWDEDGLSDRAVPKLDSSGFLMLEKI